MENKLYLSNTDVAKLIRKDLKKNFPNTKFRVKSKSYAGGCSININWVDGPKTKDVNAITAKYNSKGFDGMIDLEYYYLHYMDAKGDVHVLGRHGTEDSNGTVSSYKNSLPAGAKPVTLYSGYVFANRTMSKAFIESNIEKINAEYGLTGEFKIVCDNGGWIHCANENAFKDKYNMWPSILFNREVADL